MATPSRRTNYSFGAQVRSSQRSAPNFTFNGAPARAKLSSSALSFVGPGSYALPGAMDKQPMSTVRTEAVTKFALGPRPDPAAISSTPVSIGPGNYPDQPVSMGKQMLSPNRSAPSIGFGAGARPKPYAACATMGVRGDLKYSSYGKQPLSTMRSGPRSSISGRNSFGAVKSSSIGPGPAAFKLPGGLGKQYNSRYKTLCSVGFATSQRQKSGSSAHETPGPGSYRLKSSVGKSALSTHRSTPSFSMGGRESFVNTRF